LGPRSPRPPLVAISRRGSLRHPMPRPRTCAAGRLAAMRGPTSRPVTWTGRPARPCASQTRHKPVQSGHPHGVPRKPPRNRPGTLHLSQTSSFPKILMPRSPPRNHPCPLAPARAQAGGRAGAPRARQSTCCQPPPPPIHRSWAIRGKACWPTSASF